MGSSIIADRQHESSGATIGRAADHSHRPAETVRLIFRRYAELGSVALLRTELDHRNIRSKRREGAGGRLAGGQRFSRGALYLLLQNRLYRGEVKHKYNVYPGQHDAIVDADLWQIVQDKLASKRRERSLAGGVEAPSLLAGLIFDSNGNRMSATHAVKKGKRYRYYVSAPLITGSRNEHLNGRRIPAGDIEGLVFDRLRALFASEKEVGEAIAPLALEAPMQRAVLDRSAKLAKRWTAFASLELRALVQSLVRQVRVGDAEISVSLNRAGVVSGVIPDATPGQTECKTAVEPAVLSIVARLRRAGKGIRLVIGDGSANRIDSGLASLIAQALATRNMLLAGADDSIEAMASRLGVRRDCLTVLVRLSYLSPEIVRAILIGRQPVGLSATRLVVLSKDMPHDWRAQPQVLGFSAA